MPGRLAIHIEKTGEELSNFAAHQLCDFLSLAIEERGSGSLVLSGGATPRRVYQLLGTPPLSKKLDWSRLHLFFGDERTVPPDHPDSNYGMARRELIDRVPIPKENVHRIQGELEPQRAASVYADELALMNNGKTPRFDCILLGLGEDGHTASLFPGTEVLREHEKTVAALFVSRLKVWRVTLTFPVINNAREIVFLAEGEKKSTMVQKIIESPAPTPEIPATMVRPHDGVLRWFLDSQAASAVRQRSH